MPPDRAERCCAAPDLTFGGISLLSPAAAVKEFGILTVIAADCSVGTNGRRQRSARWSRQSNSRDDDRQQQNTRQREQVTQILEDVVIFGDQFLGCGNMARCQRCPR